MKSIAHDVIGELLETGQQAAKQAVGVPGQIVKGALPGAKANPPSNIPPKRSDMSGRPPVPDLERMFGSQKSQTSPAAQNNDNIMQLIQADNQKRQSGMDQARQQLAAIKIKRYREIQQEIEKARRKKEEEIPAYMAGKPGAPRTWKEKMEQDEKQKKEAQKTQEQDRGAVLPKGPRPRGSLFFAEEHQGSSELKKGVQG